MKFTPLEIGGERYSVWKSGNFIYIFFKILNKFIELKTQELITIERYILKELGFYLYSISEHPHKYLLHFIQVSSLFNLYY